MNSVLHQILEKTDIVELYQEIFPDRQLRRVGSGYRDLCPFHSENTPSFHIDPGRQIFKCFGSGCGAGGNVVSLVMMGKGLDDVRHAIKYLADRAGVKVNQSGWKALQWDFTLFKILEVTWSICKDLVKEEGNPVKEWIDKKKFDQWERLSIGRYPDPDKLKETLLEMGFEEEAIKRSGVVHVSKEDQKELNCKSVPRWAKDCITYPYYSWYDRINRLKIRDPKAIDKHKECFVGMGEKGIYGLDMYDFRQSEERCVVVEGETDVLAIQNLFLKETDKYVNVLCGSGGATSSSIKEFRKLGIRNLWIMADNDESGISLVKRIILDNETLEVGKVILELPEGVNDPYDYVQTVDSVEEFKKILATSKRPCIWIAEKYLIRKMKEYDGPEEEKVSWIRRKVLEYGTTLLTNEMDMDDYVSTISSYLKVDEETLKKELKSLQIEEISNAVNSNLYLKGNRLWIRDPDREIANFHIEWKKEKIIHEDDGTSKRWMIGRIIGEKKWPFIIKASDLPLDSKFAASLSNAAGSGICFDQTKSNFNYLRRAAKLFSTSQKEEEWYMAGGYIGDHKYVTPSILIDGGSIRENKDYNIYHRELSSSSYLDLKQMDPSIEANLFNHIIKELLNLTESEVMYSLFSFAHAPIIFNYVELDQKVALWIIGLTGKGKSFAARTIQSFYGDFMPEGRVETWGSTPMSLEKAGYHYKDALYLIDDWKGSITNRNQAVRVLQNYADSQGRRRLNSSSEEQRSFFIRGFLHVTAEDIPKREASVLARMIVVPWIGAEKNLEIGAKIQDMSPYYPMYMSEFIRWVHVQPDKGIFNKKFKEYRSYYFNQFSSTRADETTSNDLRISNNLGFLMTCWWSAVNFIHDKGYLNKEAAETLIEGFMLHLNNIRFKMIGFVSEEQEGRKLIETLYSLYRTMRVHILSEDECREIKEGNEEIRRRKPNVIGMLKDRQPEYVFLYPDLSIDAVNKTLKSQGMDIQMSRSAVDQQLIAEGILVPDSHGNPTVAQRDYGIHGGKTIPRMWKIRKEYLGITGTDDDFEPPVSSTVMREDDEPESLLSLESIGDEMAPF